MENWCFLWSKLLYVVCVSWEETMLISICNFNFTCLFKSVWSNKYWFLFLNHVKVSFCVFSCGFLLILTYMTQTALLGARYWKKQDKHHVSPFLELGKLAFVALLVLIFRLPFFLANLLLLCRTTPKPIDIHVSIWKGHLAVGSS